MTQQKGEMLNPLLVRIWHWVHGIAIVLLVLTGIQLRFPDLVTWFGTFKSAVNIHNILGFIVFFDYFLWLGFYLVKKELVKQYAPTPEDFAIGIPTQANYYFARIFLGDPPPFEPRPEAKFNSLQKTAYFGIMFIMLPLQIITGLLLWDLETFRPIIEAVGGVRVVDAFHVILAYIFTAFLITHIYLGTLGHTVFAHFKAMILGYEEKEVAEVEPERTSS
ncbi:MAG: cytochrome b/b6 domain-containing protein [Deltaproteobacteria bacterium]|nr:cytochrome b/b6 domain-containing protein [Deltaproteobacteria bacterium]